MNTYKLTKEKVIKNFLANNWTSKLYQVQSDVKKIVYYEKYRGHWYEVHSDKASGILVLSSMSCMLKDQAGIPYG